MVARKEFVWYAWTTTQWKQHESKMTVLLEAGNESIICGTREGKGKREVMSQIYWVRGISGTTPRWLPFTQGKFCSRGVHTGTKSFIVLQFTHTRVPVFQSVLKHHYQTTLRKLHSSCTAQENKQPSTQVNCSVVAHNQPTQMTKTKHIKLNTAGNIQYLSLRLNPAVSKQAAQFYAAGDYIQVCNSSSQFCKVSKFIQFIILLLVVKKGQRCQKPHLPNWFQWFSLNYCKDWTGALSNTICLNG